MINNIKLFNNNIVKYLKKDISYGLFVMILFSLSYFYSKGKLNLKGKYNNLLVILLIFYLSFFVPRYGIILTVFYFYYKFCEQKKRHNQEIELLKKRIKNKSKTKKKESFSTSNTYITETYSDVSSCQVCKTFARKPATDVVAHFKNKKINDRIEQDANFRKKKQV